MYGAIGSDIVHSGPFSLTHTLQRMGSRRTFLLEPMPVHEMCTIRIEAGFTKQVIDVTEVSSPESRLCAVTEAKVSAEGGRIIGTANVARVRLRGVDVMLRCVRIHLSSSLLSTDAQFG